MTETNEAAGIGHNSGIAAPPGPAPDADTPSTGDAPAVFAAAQLRAFIERVERLNEEKQSIADDIKEVYAEAKATGFDTKTMQAIVRLRKLDAGQRAEMEALQNLYLHALGMRGLSDE